MTPRNRSLLFVGTIVVMVLVAAGHFLNGAHRTLPWFFTFLVISNPVLLTLANWSFDRDMRRLAAGTLVMPSKTLTMEVSLAIATMFMWIAFATFSSLEGLPPGVQSGWLFVGLVVWLIWFAWTLRRARGYAFTFKAS